MPDFRLPDGPLDSIALGPGSGFDTASNVAFVEGTALANLFDLRSIVGYQEDHYYFYLFAGDDTFLGSQTDDNVEGGDGDDLLQGNGGDDELRGGAGNDTLDGGPGDDLLWLDSDATEEDVILGGPGYDTARPYDIFATFAQLDFGPDSGVEVFNLDNRLVDGTAQANRFDFSGLLEVRDGPQFELLQGNDTFIGSVSADRVNGGAGDDQLSGGNGNDLLLGGAGVDTLTGGDGNDTLGTGDEGDGFNDPGRDVIHGGAGLDTLNLYYGNTQTRLILDEAASVEILDFYVTVLGANIPLYGTQGADLVDISGVKAFVDDDRFELLGDDDMFVGSVLAEDVRAGDGDDLVDAGDGNDTLTGGAGDDTISGGAGNDTALFNINSSEASFAAISGGIRVTSSLGVDDLYGVETLTFRETVLNVADLVAVSTPTEGADSLAGSALRDQIDLLGGNDTYYGLAGADTIMGGAGNDLLGAGVGDDVLDGGAGNDLIWTAAGGDTAQGGAGDDTIGGAAGDDSLDGGEGDDALWGALGNDALSGGADDDTLGGAMGNDSLSGDDGADELWGADGTDTLSGGAGNDQLGGGTGNDSADGGAGNDTVSGGLGDDTLFGGTGDDLIFGAAGADEITGGAGNDTVWAGPGVDVVIFGAGDGADLVNLALADTLRLDDALWGGGLTEAQVLAQFGSVSGADYLLDFGGGDSVTLAGLGSASQAQLEALIDIV